MGYDCGFDMVPPPEKTGRDVELWKEFLEDVTSEYNYDGVFRYQANDTIEFLVGEHPSLPQQGWKFLRFSSKVSGGLTAAAEPYVKGVARIARKHFGDRVKFWHELVDKYGHYEYAKVSKSLRTYDENCGFKKEGQPKEEVVSEKESASRGETASKEDGTGENGA